MSARGVAPGVDPSPHEPGLGPDRAPEDDEQRQAWAAAMGVVPPAVLPRAALPAELTEQTPVGWRPTDVSLTDLAEILAQGDANVGAGEGSRAPAAVVSRIETAVETSALGRVSFIVDRSNAGMSIVVEVSSQAAADAVEKDRRLLLSTLRTSGITVLSFRVLLRRTDGPNLAVEPDVSNAAQPRRPARYRSPIDPEDDVPSSRVEVVG